MYTVRARTLVVVLTACLCGAALLATTAPVIAAQEDPELDVSYEYQIEQDDPQDVLIEAVVHNPDDVDDTISMNVPDYVEIEDEDGLEEVDGPYQVESGVDSATVVYSLPVEELAESYSPYSIEAIAPDHSWAVIEPHSLLNNLNHYELNETHWTAQGDRFEQGSTDEPYFLFGPVEAATAHGENATISVLGPPETMPESPTAVAEALADVSDVVEAGETDHDVLAFGVPHIDDYVGLAPSSEVHYSEYDERLYGTGSTWIHEYVHNTENIALGRDMLWFTEGYADYGTALFGTEAGYQDFDQYSSDLESWSGERVVLADEDAWDDSSRENYDQGARVLAALDYEIRDSTDGEATIQDVVAGMYDAHTADLETFTDIVADVADEDVAADAETWITTTEPILEDGIWNHSEHEEVFDGAPNLVTTDVEVAAVNGDEERTLKTDTTSFALSAEQELQTTITLENQGSVDGTTDPFHVKAFLTLEPLTPFTPVTVDAGESETMSFTYQYDGADPADVRIDDVTKSLFVEDVKTMLSVADVGAAEPDDAVGLADDASELGVHPGSTGSEIAVETLDGDLIAEVDDTGHTERIDAGSFDRPATYEVTFDTGGETHTRYVTTLDRVEGTVPVDLNSDGAYRDFNGDGTLSQTDVTIFSRTHDRPEIQDHVPSYDYTGDGAVNDDDVQALFDHVAA